VIIEPSGLGHPGGEFPVIDHRDKHAMQQQNIQQSTAAQQAAPPKGKTGRSWSHQHAAAADGLLLLVVSCADAFAQLSKQGAVCTVLAVLPAHATLQGLSSCIAAHCRSCFYFQALVPLLPALHAAPAGLIDILQGWWWW
jgi:hypothetical protein